MPESIMNIVYELRESNSQKHKRAVLEKYADDDNLSKVLRCTLDQVRYTYGVSLTALTKYMKGPAQYVSGDAHRTHEPSIGDMFDLLESMNARMLTGNAAMNACTALLRRSGVAMTELFKIIIDRNLHAGVGRTLVNKVNPGLITKIVYMRCGVYSEKTAKRIKFPAMVQLKADGTYREFVVTGGEVQCRSRSGQTYVYTELNNVLSQYPDGVYFGELTVRGISNRAVANGLLMSSDVPGERLVLSLWDVVQLSEYRNAQNKVKNTAVYQDRFDSLRDIVSTATDTDNVAGRRVVVIETRTVQCADDALSVARAWMRAGYEGGVLKNTTGVFRDGTSTDQLKMKLEVQGEFRVTGFTDGKLGTKREGKVGAVMFETDDRAVRGQCSGFTDAVMNEMTDNPDAYIDTVVTVQFNDLVQPESREYLALSHPRFIEFRSDRDDTDTLQTLQDTMKMTTAMA